MPVYGVTNVRSRIVAQSVGTESAARAMAHHHEHDLWMQRTHCEVHVMRQFELRAIDIL